jgi:hypothetical protein
MSYVIAFRYPSGSVGFITDGLEEEQKAYEFPSEEAANDFASTNTFLEVVDFQVVELAI